MPEKIKPEVLDSGITSIHIPVLESWGKHLASKNGQKEMTTSQIRKFFGEIKRIQADFDNCSNEVILLDPKIAYAVGRARKDARRDEKVAIADFYDLVNPLLRAINGDRKKFKHFVQVCESIVAYHKAAGGQ